MKYNVTEIKFDFDEGDIDDPITFEEQVQIIHDNLGVWEADNEDDLIEEITTSSGWCIKSIDYDIQLKLKTTKFYVTKMERNLLTYYQT